MVEEEKIENEGESVDEWGPPEYYHSNVNVDEVLKELVERKSKLQSFTQFNLDYAVDVSIQTDVDLNSVVYNRIIMDLRFLGLEP